MLRIEAGIKKLCRYILKSVKHTCSSHLEEERSVKGPAIAGRVSEDGGQQQEQEGGRAEEGGNQQAEVLPETGGEIYF